MSKYINIKVSATVSTDFYIEVPDNADNSKIKELAEKEVILPHNYPNYLNNFLRQHMNLRISGIDSMLKSWNIDDLKYLFDGNNLLD